jgi:hypothetical protein
MGYQIGAIDAETPSTHSSNVSATAASRSDEHLAFQLNAPATVVTPEEQDANSAASDAVAAASPYGIIIEDGLPAGDGQINRTAFMNRMAPAIERTAGDLLKPAGREAKDCPYLGFWLNHYREQSAAHIERVIAKYVKPEQTDVAGIERAILSHVGEAVTAWVDHGAMQVPGEVDWHTRDDGVDAAPGEGAVAQRMREDGQGAPAAPGSAAAIKGQLTNGRPLDASVRSRMERGFGTSLGAVRIHTDSTAAAAARRYDARAFTIGRDVSFASNQFQPGTTAGDLLLAHELAHVIQQRGAAEEPQTWSTARDDALEVDADSAAIYAVGRAGVAPEGLSRHISAHPPTTAHGGLRLQRCGSDDVDFAKLATKPDYEWTLVKLAELYAQKDEINSGERDISELESVNAHIDEQIAQLRILGIELDEDEIYRRVTDVAHLPGQSSMQTVTGRILRSPQGPAYLGQRLTFQFAPDYLPPQSDVKIAWYYRATGDKTFGEGAMQGGTNPMTAVPANVGMSVTLAERFWTKSAQEPFIEQIEKRGGFVPVAAITTAGSAPVEIQGDFVPLASRPASFEVEVVPSIPMPNSGATLRVKDWAPLRGRFIVVWSYDGMDLGPALLKDNVQVGNAGAHTIVGTLFKAKGSIADEALTPVGAPIAVHAKAIEVRGREAIGEQALTETAKLEKAPKLSELEISIKASMQEIAKRGVLGGEREAYWQDRYKSQQKRLDKLGELVPDFKETKDLPADPTALDETATYSAAIPATIVYGGAEGNQAISLFLTARKSGNSWSARLVDITGSKVVKFDGSGASSLAAFTAAFETWKSDNPYPTGGLVVYKFSPPGWSFPKSFSTTTPWKTAKDWVDGILEVGGTVIGALLLLAPDATVTKVAGLALLGLGVARSGVGIYERLQLGYAPLDRENVLDGIVIVTSLLGLGGGVLRSIGAEARSLSSAPLVYRVGSWMVVTTLAADVGTLVYLTEDAMAQLRVARGDPTMDDSQRAEMMLRVVSSLLVQGIMIFVSNRDLFAEGLKASDFVKTRLPETETVSLSKGMRLDIELELRKAGEDPKAVKAMGERQLLSNFLIVQRRQKTITGVEKLRASLSWDAQTEFDAARLRHDSIESFKAEVEKYADAKQHFEGLAAEKKKNKPAATATEVPPPLPLPVATTSAIATQVDRMTKLHPASKLTPARERALVPRAEGEGFIAGADAQVRVNGQVDVHPTKLAKMSDADLKVLLEATYDLAGQGGDISKVTAPTKKALESLASRERFRFEYQLKQGDQFLAEMGLKDQGIFRNISDFDRQRIYDVTRVDVPGGTKNLKALAADYARSRKPASPREWANHFEFFMAMFKQKAKDARADFNARIAKAVNEWEVQNSKTASEKDVDRIRQQQTKQKFGGKAISDALNEKVEADLTASGDPTTLSASARTSIGAVYEDMVKSLGARTGAISVKPGLPDNALIAAVKATAEIRFSSPDAAVYHALKHSIEMPPSEMGTDIMKSYLDITENTIKNPSRDPSVTVLPNGARSLGFLRAVNDAGVVYEVSAIVIVSPEGNVVVASVQARKQRK